MDKRTVAVLNVNNVVDGAGADGIRIKWVTDAIVRGNSVRGSGGYGLAFEDSHTDRITIDKNVSQTRWATGTLTSPKKPRLFDGELQL